MEHTPRKIISNTFLFTGTMIVQKMVSFLYFWFLSDRLNPSLLGTYIWALSLTGVFSIGIDLGLSPLLIREAARNPLRSEKLIRGVLGLKVLFTFVTLFLLYSVLYFSHRDAVTFLVVIIASAVMIFDSFTTSFYSILRARQNIRFESIGMLCVQILVFAIGFFLLGVAQSPILAMVTLAIGSFFNLAYSWFIVRFVLEMRVKPMLERKTISMLLRILPSFAIAGIFVRLYNVTDSVLLGYFANETAVGLYSVPAKVVTAFQMLIPGAFIASIYPAMSYFFKNDRIVLEKIFSRSVGYLLIIVLPITIGLFSIVPRVLDVIWPSYVAVKPTFLLMVLGLPFLFLTFPTGYLLNACDRERKNTANRGITTAINIGSNLLLIPFYGVFGAGLAFLITNILLFFFDVVAVQKIITPDWNWVAVVGLKAFAASAFMLLFIFWSHGSLPLIITVGVAAIIYLVLVVLFRVFTKEEIQTVKDLFKHRATVQPPQI